MSEEATAPSLEAFKRMFKSMGLKNFPDDEPVTVRHFRIAACAAANAASKGKWSDPATPYGMIGRPRVNDLAALLVAAGADQDMAEISAVYIASQVIFRVTGPEIPKQEDATVKRDLAQFAKALKKLDASFAAMGGAARHHLSISFYQSQLVTESDDALRAEVLKGRKAKDLVTHAFEKFRHEVFLFECVADICSENFKSSGGPTVDHNERNALRNAIDQWVDATGCWPVDSRKTEPPKSKMEKRAKTQPEIEKSANVADPKGLNAPLLDAMRSMALAVAPESPRACFSDYAYIATLRKQKDLRKEENIPSPSGRTPPSKSASSELSNSGDSK